MACVQCEYSFQCNCCFHSYPKLVTVCQQQLINQRFHLIRIVMVCTKHLLKAILINGTWESKVSLWIGSCFVVITDGRFYLHIRDAECDG